MQTKKSKHSINYRIKTVNEDFRVKEISFSPPLKEKSHSSYSYILLKKEGLTTFDLIERIRAFFKLNFNDISAEGLKDEDGITEQLISIKAILDKADLQKFNANLRQKKEKAQILQIIGYGEEAAQPGILHGNAFEITVRNLTKTQAEKIVLWCQNNKYFSFINYYDSQRFGTPGSIHNTHVIGKAIISNNWKEAYSEFIKSGNREQIIMKTETERLVNARCKKIMTEAINPQKISFFISSYNSYLWNKKASKVIDNHGGKAFLDFDISDKLAIYKKNCFTCPNSLSVSAYEYNKENQSVNKKIKVRVLITTTTIIASGIFNDELYKGKSKINLSFFLPVGSYATMAIKQLFCSIFS